MLHNVYSHVKGSAIRVLYCVVTIVHLQTPSPCLYPLPTLPHAVSPGVPELLSWGALWCHSVQPALDRWGKGDLEGRGFCPRSGTGNTLSVSRVPAIVLPVVPKCFWELEAFLQKEPHGEAHTQGRQGGSACVRPRWAAQGPHH